MAKVTASKILELANKEIGTKATNIKKCKYNTAFYGSAVSGSAYDWCAVFIWWLFKQAGAADMLYVKTAGCGVLGNAFYTRNKFKTSGYKPGDIVFFHWSNNKSESVPITYSLDHVGIIEKCNGDGTYTTIEGNTGSTSNGEVKRQIRSASVISGICRPDYAKEETSTKKTTSTTSGKTVKVINKKSYLRSQAYVDDMYNSSKKLKTCPIGTTLTWVKDDGYGWSYCKASDGTAGWIQNTRINKSGTSKYPTATVTGDAVRVRKAPNGTILKQVNKGTKFTAYYQIESGTNKGWTAVSVSGQSQDCYISSQYVNLTKRK